MKVTFKQSNTVTKKIGRIILDLDKQSIIINDISYDLTEVEYNNLASIVNSKLIMEQNILNIESRPFSIKVVDNEILQGE